jgi:UDPglucose--hexose-1-phosphate uridylyltransferase
VSVKSAFKPKMHPHPRFNPLTRVWMLVSPHRTQRPWQGQVESVSRESALPFDPNCYLCPGNARAGGARNPQYPETFMFDNDFATLRPDTQPGEIHENDMLVAQSETGRCRVVCFSPRHDLALARLSVDDIKRVVDVWAAEYTALGSLPTVSLVQIFENRGVMMSCSNPHPHGQIWVSDILLDEPVRELSSFVDYFRSTTPPYLKITYRWSWKNGSASCAQTGTLSLLFRSGRSDRLKSWCSAGDALVLYPNCGRLSGWLWQTYSGKLRYLFNPPFPYTMGFHQKPTDGQKHPEFRLHGHFYPPLLRSATVKKFMVGYELLAMPQRDITTETAAAYLRETSDVHYLEES